MVWQLIISAAKTLLTIYEGKKNESINCDIDLRSYKEA